MKDIRGLEINVGDTIAKPSRSSSSCYINAYKVIEIDEYLVKAERLTNLTQWNGKPSRAKVTLTRYQILKITLPDVPSLDEKIPSIS